MLADAPLESSIRGARKSTLPEMFKAADEHAAKHEERRRRRKKHRNKQRPERPNKGRRKKGLGKGAMSNSTRP